jgi:outer membrane protein TolC
LETIPASHPKLRFYNFKLSGLEVDRKLKFQELLPTVNLRTNILNKGYNVLSNIQKNAFYENNNKFGIEVGIPLRFSKGRGEYKMAKLKIKETNLEVAMLKQQLINKTKFYFNELTGLQQQVKQYESVYNNYQLLLKGEELKFRSGESSLFLLNNRENKVLETSLKLNELKIKFLKSQASLQWAAGLLK